MSNPRRGEFPCERCGKVFTWKPAITNHLKSCGNPCIVEGCEAISAERVPQCLLHYHRKQGGRPEWFYCKGGCGATLEGPSVQRGYCGDSCDPKTIKKKIRKDFEDFIRRLGCRVEGCEGEVFVLKHRLCELHNARKKRALPIEGPAESKDWEPGLACIRPGTGFAKGNEQGTAKGYNRHRGAGEEACEPCLAAIVTKGSARRAKKKAADGEHTLEEWLWVVEDWGGLCAFGVMFPEESLCKGALAVLRSGRKVPPTEQLTKGHVIPLEIGGSDDITNIVPQCRSCNSSQGFKTVDEWLEVRRSK